MEIKRKFYTAQDELFFNSRVEEIGWESPALANKLDPDYYNKLQKKARTEDPSTTVFGMFKLKKEYSEFRNSLKNLYDPQKSKIIRERIFLLNHCLNMEADTDETIVEAVKSFKVEFTAQISELEKLLVSNLRKSNNLPKYPKIVMGHLAAILIGLKTDKESPVFGFTKSKLSTVAFQYFRDKNGKKFENKKSFCSMLYQTSKYSKNDLNLVKLQLDVMSIYIKDL